MPAPTDADHDPQPADLPKTDAIAAAIAAGKDLGVFDLCSAVAKAREAIPLGGCTRKAAAIYAAAGIRAAFDKVATGFLEIDSAPEVCPCCELREQLDRFVDVAVAAVADESGKGAPSYEERLVDACKELAHYAGDEFPDEDATRAVLELARDVFLAAFSVMSPEGRR